MESPTPWYLPPTPPPKKKPTHTTQTTHKPTPQKTLKKQVAAARVAALAELEKEGDDEDGDGNNFLLRFPAPRSFSLRVVRDEGATVRRRLCLRLCFVGVWIVYISLLHIHSPSPPPTLHTPNQPTLSPITPPPTSSPPPTTQVREGPEPVGDAGNRLLRVLDPGTVLEASERRITATGACVRAGGRIYDDVGRVYVGGR